MKKPKVFIAAKIPDFVEEYIGKHCDYERFNEDRLCGYKDLPGRLHDKEGLLLSGIRVDKGLLEHGPNLRVVSNVSVGYNNFDISAMKERNIIGTNTPGVLNDTVADTIFGLILAAARKIPMLDKYVKDGRWNKGSNSFALGKDVHHSVLGIIGMGGIGQVVAKRAKFGFDMDVLYYNRTRKYSAEESLGVKYADFNTLLQKSDFILVMTPLTDETYHIIGWEQFNMMKSDAIFINASRGATVDEESLIRALEENKILGAGLDVYEKEPVSADNLLLKMPNVVTLPHIGSATEKTRNSMAMLGAENMVRALYGEIPPNVVPELA